MKKMDEGMEKRVAEEATGCVGAGDYREYAKKHGFPHLAVVDWTSSAGNWTFIVSKDGVTWHVMTQTNNYPRRGFTWMIEDEQPYYGTESEVLQQIVDESY